MKDIATRTEAAALADLKTGIQAYDSILNRFRRSGGDIRKPEDVFTFIERMSDGYQRKDGRRVPYSVQSVNTARKAFKRVLTDLAKASGGDSTYQRFLINLKFNEELGSVRVDTRIHESVILTREELRSIIAGSSPKAALLLRALYQTAARISELLSIRLTDCKVQKGICSIRVIGKGQKERQVRIDADLYESIRAEYAGKVYLFETRNNNRLDRSNVWRVVSAAGEIVGIKNLHPHSLRHTWATWNLPALGIYTVSAYLGHADISTTAKFYLHNEPTNEQIKKSWEI